MLLHFNSSTDLLSSSLPSSFTAAAATSCMYQKLSSQLMYTDRTQWNACTQTRTQLSVCDCVQVHQQHNVNLLPFVTSSLSSNATGHCWYFYSCSYFLRN